MHWCRGYYEDLNAGGGGAEARWHLNPHSVREKVKGIPHFFLSHLPT